MNERRLLGVWLVFLAACGSHMGRAEEDAPSVPSDAGAADAPAVPRDAAAPADAAAPTDPPSPQASPVAVTLSIKNTDGTVSAGIAVTVRDANGHETKGVADSAGNLVVASVAPPYDVILSSEATSQYEEWQTLATATPFLRTSLPPQAVYGGTQPYSTATLQVNAVSSTGTTFSYSYPTLKATDGHSISCYPPIYISPGPAQPATTSCTVYGASVPSITVSGIAVTYSAPLYFATIAPFSMATADTTTIASLAFQPIPDGHITGTLSAAAGVAPKTIELTASYAGSIYLDVSRTVTATGSFDVVVGSVPGAKIDVTAQGQTPDGTASSVSVTGLDPGAAGLALALPAAGVVITPATRASYQAHGPFTIDSAASDQVYSFSLSSGSNTRPSWLIHTRARSVVLPPGFPPLAKTSYTFRVYGDAPYSSMDDFVVAGASRRGGFSLTRYLSSPADAE